MEGQIIWVDCADEEQVPKDDKNNLVLDFPSPVSNSPGPSTNSLVAGQPIKRQAKDFTEAEKAAIVDECTVEMYSPTLLAEKYNINVTSIRGWIKSAGKTLPQKYKFNASSYKQQTKPPMPSSAQSMSPAQQNPPQIHFENPSNTTEKGSQKFEVLELPARKELPKGGFYSREFTGWFVISPSRWTKLFF